MKLVSIGYLEGFYYKPRIDKEVLRQHSEGLICSSACLKGEINHLILSNQLDAARKVAGEYNEIFGKGNFYLEMMDHGIAEQKQANEELIKISKRTKHRSRWNQRLSLSSKVSCSRTRSAFMYSDSKLL